ncbi:MAG: hypothetical protein IKF19_06675 [Bacilli bacterium]|nr:hypothetical protein [Bacilli bacterium]
MIYTSSYKNCKTNKYRTFSISKDKGKDANYNGYCYLKLAPLESFFRIWRNNIGKLSKKENNEYYIKEYYNNILKNLDPKEVYKVINNSILLCYEDNNEFCHRHIVAAWLEYYLDIAIFEVKVKDNVITIIDKPEYIKEYLEKVIRDSKNIGNSFTINKTDKLKIKQRKNKYNSLKEH